MLVVNFIPMLLGYLLKVIMFRHRGFGNDYAKGYAEAKIALPKIKKPKFYWRNLPNLFMVRGQHDRWAVPLPGLPRSARAEIT